MKIVTTITNQQPSDNCTAVALGFFDGVHLAHQKIINTAVSYKRTANLVPTIMTFEPDQESDCKRDKKLILPNEIKYEVFARHGVEQVYTPKFSEIKDMSPESFFDKVLIEKLKAKVLICGYNYTFGKEAKGTTDELMELCIKNNIEISIVNPVKVENLLVSSSAVRAALLNGDIEKVTKMLASNYFIKGVVVKGNQLGRTLGFPTANIEFSDNQIIPKYGVYKTLVYIGSKIYSGLTNVGLKPTVGGVEKPLAETYILDFSGELYGEIVVVGFTKMLRSEKKFANLNELKQAMNCDLNEILS